MKIQSTKQEILFHSTALNVDIIPHIISCEYLTEHKNVFCIILQNLTKQNRLSEFKVFLYTLKQLTPSRQNGSQTLI